MQIRPEDCAIDVMHGVEHMVVVAPVDTEEGEAEDIGEKVRQDRPQRLEVRAARHTQLEDHDGDEDRDDSVAEGFETAFAHRARRSAISSWIAVTSRFNFSSTFNTPSAMSLISFRRPSATVSKWSRVS